MSTNTSEIHATLPTIFGGHSGRRRPWAAHSDDDQIFDWATENNAVVITADSDFAMLLATRRTTTPSVVLLRDVADQPPAVHAKLPIGNLSTVEPELATGAIVSLSPTRLRIRSLPIE